MKTLTAIAKRMRIRGTVQGVGFRPFVHRLAMRHGLAGHVRNRSGDVEIVVQGAGDAVESFVRELPAAAPPTARIDDVAVFAIKPSGRDEFVIAESSGDTDGTSPISPDVATCDDCLRELFATDDRRYRYPFITCAQCGPRYTIARTAPYDRLRTSMAGFTMCDECRREYADPADRRFHAQAIACARCGPRVDLVDASGNSVESGDPVRAAADRLCGGEIVAVKGLGGYHLAVDAANETAVRELRRRKFRERKPFAVMVRDVDAVRSLCQLSNEERDLLVSPRRPIVLLQRRRYEATEPRDFLKSLGSALAPAVAGPLPEIGVMLAYTPLHHLLLADFEAIAGRPAVLVMTSGNRSDEPIAFENADALRTLRGIADCFLVHNRPIEHRCDDTVTRWVSGREMVVRRSRGDVPGAICVPCSFPEPVLACGAHLKNTVCIGVGGQAVIGPHIGDLEHYDALRAFEQSIEHLTQITRTAPRIIAHDLHPDYPSTNYALRQTGVTRVGVQHHHAHVASVIAEHGLPDKVIGVAFDGTGYGTDGAVWGGEFLIADCAGFVRAAHLQYVPLPGGEQAVRQPWRMAAAWLDRALGEEFTQLDLPFARRIDPAKWRPLKRMIERGINSPPTSSMGRLFDAVAAVVAASVPDARSVRDTFFEGEAAMELESIADERVEDGYEFALRPPGGRGWTEGKPRHSQGRGFAKPPAPATPPSFVDADPVIRAVVEDLQRGVPAGIVSARFHVAVADMIVAQCTRLRAKHGLNRVALSGGVFQNRLLTTLAFRRLRDAGFEVNTNHRIPVNDGGISFGQAVVAAASSGA